MRYHHGDLRRALLDSLPGLIVERGLERLSLRELARRAGVSHGAPAHHFGDRRGLLTAFAIEASERLAEEVRHALEGVPEDAHAARLVAVGLGYLEFALCWPAHFRVTFRPELLDMNDATLRAARAAAGDTLDEVLRAAERDGELDARDYAQVRMASWAVAHGYASLAVEVLAAGSPDALRRQARRTFEHFSGRMLGTASGRRALQLPASGSGTVPPR
jgi:AcrR family transcriptional regulator